MEFWKVKALTYLSGIWLYRWYALGITWLCCLLGWGVIAALPDQYKVEAKVYIDADSLMGPLLRGLTVNTDPNQQVNIMLKTLITRPNLEQVIHITQPKSVSWTPAQLEKGVEALEKKMYITYLGTKNYYAFGYTDNKSAYAESVAQTLLSILVDSNIGNKRRDLEGARSFIDQKVTEYEDRLREADKRRADYKTANLDVMGGGRTHRQAGHCKFGLDAGTKGNGNGSCETRQPARDTRDHSADGSDYRSRPARERGGTTSGGTGGRGRKSASTIAAGQASTERNAPEVHGQLS